MIGPYKIVSFLDENGEKISREEIYSYWSKWETRNFLNNMNHYILKDKKNCSIYLRLNYDDNKNSNKKNNKNRDIPAFQIPDLFEKLYDVVRMNVSYFHIKPHINTGITGSRDIDGYLFKFLDVFDAFSLLSVNSYFKSLGDLYFKNETFNYSKWGDGKYVKYVKDKTEKYPVRGREWEKERKKEKFWISRYLSFCKVSYISNYGMGNIKTFSPRKGGEAKILGLGRSITITYPDGVSRTYSKKREYKTKDIIRFMLKAIGEESKTNEYVSFGFVECENI